MTVNGGKYYPATRPCSGKATPGAVALMEWHLDTYAAVGATNLGIYGCRAVGGTTILSVHGNGRADDLGIPVRASWGQAEVDFLHDHSAELGIQQLIYRRRIWSCNHGPDWHPYDGESAHEEHCHAEVDLWGAEHLTVALLNSFYTGAGKGDDMIFAIKDGPRKDHAGRAGGGTHEFAPDEKKLEQWRADQGGVATVYVTEEDVQNGRIGVEVSTLRGGGGGLVAHTHTISATTGPATA